jgi:RNA polymerase sigma-70 factor (ECF subfamily)
MLRNREDAEDVLQEAIYKAFEHLQSFRGTCRFSVWLTQIAINSAFMLMRKRKSRSEVSFDQQADAGPETQTWEFPDRAPNAEQIYVKRQAIERMLVAIDRIKVGTAKSRLLRARMKMRSSLKKQKISFADACN